MNRILVYVQYGTVGSQCLQVSHSPCESLYKRYNRSPFSSLNYIFVTTIFVYVPIEYTALLNIINTKHIQLKSKTSTSHHRRIAWDIHTISSESKNKLSTLSRAFFSSFTVLWARYRVIVYNELFIAMAWGIFEMFDIYSKLCFTCCSMAKNSTALVSSA